MGGDHIRQRVRVPEEGHWPVGGGLSAEIGCQQRKFPEDTWSVEIRHSTDHLIVKMIPGRRF